MKGISAVIITLNEEHKLPRALDSLKGVVDEVLVVDSGSTDQTEAICRAYGARFIYHPWEGYGAQKNFGIDQAQHHWILSLDADEVLDETLRETIQTIEDPQTDIYWINRMPNYCGHWVRHSGWYPQYIPRLFDRRCARWSLRKVHESLESQQDARNSKLRGHILHYTYKDLAEQRAKAYHYALLGAKELYETGHRVGAYKAWLSASFKFFQYYILRLGFLDSWAGWHIARYAAITTFRKYKHLHTLSKYGYAKRILISRPDGIGDLVMTLPLAGWYRAQYPDAEVWVLGRQFNQAIALADPHVSGFISLDHWMQISDTEIQKELQSLRFDAVVHVFPNTLVARATQGAGMAQNIGSSHRLMHWRYLNRRVKLTRKGSGQHESVLNTILMESLGIVRAFSVEALRPYHHLIPRGELHPKLQALLGDGQRPCIILHPKSKGSAREWGIENFKTLACALGQKGYRVLISGSESEGLLMLEAGFFKDMPESVVNTCGKLSIEELMVLISHCSALVAASTGPLHLASAIGIPVFGLFPSKADIDPRRWRPLSPSCTILSHPEACLKTCPDSHGHCACMQAITVEELEQIILQKIPLL